MRDFVPFPQIGKLRGHFDNSKEGVAREILNSNKADTEKISAEMVSYDQFRESGIFIIIATLESDYCKTFTVLRYRITALPTMSTYYVYIPIIDDRVSYRKRIT